MFTTSENHSKELEEVMRMQTATNPLGQLKREMIPDSRQDLHVTQSNIENDASRNISIGEIQNLTESLQNKSGELLDQSPTIGNEGPIELSSFTHQTVSNRIQNGISLETVNDVPDSTLTLDGNHYYDNLTNAPIMVYQMAPGNLVPFDSLVSVPITKPIEDKTSETVDLLNNSYANTELFNNQNTHPLYIFPDMNKFKNQENEKMLISQIYSSEDPANLFLDTRHSIVRNVKCEINITDTMNSDINLASTNFDTCVPVSSESGIHQFASATYNSTDTDSEVALTLASLGDLKNDKMKENYAKSIMDIEHNHKNEEISSENTTFKDKLPSDKDNSQPTLILRSRKGKGSNFKSSEEHKKKKHLEQDNSSLQSEIGSYQNNFNANEKCVKKTSKTKRNSSKKCLKSAVGSKETCEPHKKNLLGQLLKASKHCEPASLIPEGVVDDVIPAVGYRIMDMSNLSEMIRMMHKCSNMSSRGLIFMQEQASLREGAVSQLSIICSGCQEGAICATSSKSSENIFDINARVETLKKEFNIEEKQVQRMLEILGIFYRPAEVIPAPVQPPSPTPEKVFELEDWKKRKRKKKALMVKKKEKNIECKVCHKKFSGMNHLKSHMLMHDNLLHTCPYCQAYFKRVFNLQEHIKKHENVKFDCEICNKSYTDRSTLIAHIRSVHQEEHKQECEVCSKKFFHKTHYVEHMRVHTREKPYSCEICGKRYPYMNSVKRHMQTHITFAKYKCRLCGKWFRWLFGIRQHLVVQHKLKKCDIEAQVITDVISETLPGVSNTSKKLVSSRNSSVDNENTRNLEPLSDTNLDYKKQTFQKTERTDASSETVNLENNKTSSQEISACNGSNIFSNLNNWKKPL